MNRPAWTRLALLAAASAAVAGCASRSADETLTQASITPSPDEVLTPVVRGGTNGLEVLWFVCRDEQDSLARSLEPYAYQPVDLDPGAAESLRRNGLRL
ncbi:MAG: hypothetical protein ACTS27_08245, partial [Phycisphaerales bacterium]